MVFLKWRNQPIEVFSRMDKNMVKDMKFFQLRMFMRVFMSMTSSTDKADMPGLMALFIKDSFNQELLKVMVLGNPLVAIAMKDRSNMD